MDVQRAVPKAFVRLWGLAASAESAEGHEGPWEDSDSRRAALGDWEWAGVIGQLEEEQELQAIMHLSTGDILLWGL